MRTALNTGTYADPKRGAVAFGTVAEEWIEGKRTALADKTLAGYRSLLDVTVLPKWGDVPLRDMDHAGIQQWVTWLSISPDARYRPVKRDDDEEDDDTQQGLSAARVIQAFQVVDQVLAYAIRARYIRDQPRRRGTPAAKEFPRRQGTQSRTSSPRWLRQRGSCPLWSMCSAMAG